jgi:CheY-like chemotaxis protein
MVRKTVTVINFKVEEKHQIFTVNISRDIPKDLYGDEQRLAQVIANLLSNAVKFTPEQGSITLDAALEETELIPLADENVPEGYLVRVSVTDTGIGISPEQQARLFSSFTQADSSTSRKYGGTGLGLAISKRIVEMMGGHIWVESVPGQGSAFIFVVPLKKGTTVGEDPGGAVDVSAAGERGNNFNEDNLNEGNFKADNFAGFRVLLAEDVDINREIVLALLEPTGVSVECAENGAMVTRIFNASPAAFDMIFMDVQMPEMDGYEATRAIRASGAANARTIPIIAMTANVFKEDVERCLESGMNGHVGKPLDFEEVLGVLRTYLHR